jgi:hypothetical protein
VEYLEDSWMPSASEMGLSDQDLANLAAYMQTTGSQMDDAMQLNLDEPVPPTGKEPGWEVLTGEDFVNVNCNPDTWKWEQGHAYCNGRPTGVIRYREPLENFDCYLWNGCTKEREGTPGSLSGPRLKVSPSWPQVMVGCPMGSRCRFWTWDMQEVYTQRHKKPADWFTSHGDVFPVGPVKDATLPAGRTQW